jgi:hypothetical protein
VREILKSILNWFVFVFASIARLVSITVLAENDPYNPLKELTMSRRRQRQSQ